jgi:hypothetical protein
MASRPSSGYVNPLTAVPDSYRPRWRLLLEILGGKHQQKRTEDQGRVALLTERNLTEFFNPNFDPNETYDGTKGYGERTDVTEIEEWMRGLP